ncbi:MAG: hypothetical protein HQM13_12485 [SAR324 cluster bacterium]|nr:hypothetical protein [SAR324 cluster bacterium]
MKNKNFYSGNALKIILVAVIFWGMTEKAVAQYGVFEYDLFGYGLWLSMIKIDIDPAPDGASNRVKGYTDILPPSLRGHGVGGGINWKNFGFDLGLSQADVNIGQYADIQQNENPADDVFVSEARRSNQSWSILHHPFPFFYYGYGGNQGRFEFSVSVPGAGKQRRKVGFSNAYYLLGMVYSLEWDPQPRPLYILFTFFAKIPRESSSFSGKIYGIGLTGAIP